MAQYRQVHCTFWNDPEVQDFTADEKLFYLYLLTNPRSRQCGISEISIKLMSFETGLSISCIDTLLMRFESLGKIKYSKKSNEVALKNWRKYNPDTSPKVKACISKELHLIKDTSLIQYLYSIDTVSQEERERKEKERERERTPRSSFVVPTFEEVEKYFLENKSTSKEARKFCNHYNSNGWLVGGKTKMKNWHSAAGGWIERQDDFAPNGKQEKPTRQSAPRRYDSTRENPIRDAMPKDIKDELKKILS